MSELIQDISKVEITGHKLYRFAEIASEHAYWGGKHITLTVDNPFERATVYLKTKVLGPYTHSCSVPPHLAFNFQPPGGLIWLGEITRVGRQNASPFPRVFYAYDEYAGLNTGMSADFASTEWFWSGRVTTSTSHAPYPVLVPPGRFYIHTFVHPNYGTYDYLPWHHSSSSTTLLDKIDLDGSWLMLVRLA